MISHKTRNQNLSFQPGSPESLCSYVPVLNSHKHGFRYVFPRIANANITRSPDHWRKKSLACEFASSQKVHDHWATYASDRYSLIQGIQYKLCTDKPNLYINWEIFLDDYYPNHRSQIQLFLKWGRVTHSIKFEIITGSQAMCYACMMLFIWQWYNIDHEQLTNSGAFSQDWFLFSSSRCTESCLIYAQELDSRNASLPGSPNLV